MTRRDKKAKHRMDMDIMLIESLIVILTIAALTAIIVSRIGRSTTNVKIAACKANVDLINTRIELYKINTGRWPVALTDVTTDTNYFRNGPPVCPFGTGYSLSSDNRVADHNDTEHGL